MKRFSFCIFALAFLGLLHGTGFGQDKKDQPKEKEPPKDKKAGPFMAPVPAPVPAIGAPACCAPGPGQSVGCQPLVFIVNGEAGSTHLTDNVLLLNGEMRLGVRIQAVTWATRLSHSEDVVDQQAQLKAAARIACSVQAIRKDAPNLPIFLVGHSGGAHVVLRAAEMLPEKSIDRIIVVAPAVSNTYDLTRALKTSRGGIDNFFSEDDSLLDHMAESVGTADGTRCKPAGLSGFRLASSDPKDIAAYRNVRQYRWTIEFCGGGGHYTWTRYHNVKKAIMPIFSAPTTIYDGPAAATVRKMPPAP
jgi:pimeloyl-ACP methyl ester carboxylesterase